MVPSSFTLSCRLCLFFSCFAKKPKHNRLDDTRWVGTGGWLCINGTFMGGEGFCPGSYTPFGVRDDTYTHTYTHTHTRTHT
ncbi:hypothetical protein LY76DRAFT_257419 [Colletotrichum caudatum]|nr:hypothetical protein LY76DRAFT_257419 [Colletotrichum caudatum]